MIGQKMGILLMGRDMKGAASVTPGDAGHGTRLNLETTVGLAGGPVPSRGGGDAAWAARWARDPADSHSHGEPTTTSPAG